MDAARMRGAFAAIVFMLAFAVQAAEQKDADRKVSGNDRHFIAEAVEDGLAEVELGKIAQRQASSPAVKQFAQRMIEDHGKANQELEAIATKLGVTPPAEPGAVQRSDIKRLSTLAGEKFDREYAERVVKHHEHAVSLFRKEAKNGEAPELKQFAARTLPVLEAHLKRARELAAQISGTKS